MARDAQEETAAQRMARRLIKALDKAHDLMFRRKLSWLPAGRQRVYDFFEEYPELSNITVLKVITDAWSIFQDGNGNDSNLRKFYYCKQLLNPNDIFKVHPRHGEIMFLGAARELNIDVMNVDSDECLKELKAEGLCS